LKTKRLVAETTWLPRQSMLINLTWEKSCWPLMFTV